MRVGVIQARRRASEASETLKDMVESGRPGNGLKDALVSIKNKMQVLADELQRVESHHFNDEQDNCGDIAPVDYVPFTEIVGRQIRFSREAFGPPERGTEGIVKHIRKELEEIEADPNDLEEWIDVIILGMDGAWRSGFSPREVAEALVQKMDKNERRSWPDYNGVPEGEPIEHIRESE